VDDLARRVAALGPFFEFSLHAQGAAVVRPWHSVDEMLADPAGHVRLVRERLAAASGREAGAVEVRVAASVAHLGLVARLVAPVLGAAVLGEEPLSVEPSGIWWQPELGGAFPLSLSLAAGGAAGAVSLLEGPVLELSEAFAGLRVSPRILRGNVASAVNGAVAAIGRSAASQSAASQSAASRSVQQAREIAVSLYAHPALRGAATYAPDLTAFRRRSCCLIYRAAPPGAGSLCGDCVLRSVPLTWGMTWQPELDDIRRRRELAKRMGGPDKIRRQHEAGRLTVRERLAALLDQGSFQEIGTLAGAAVYDGEGELADFMAANFVTGTGRLDGRKVVVGADDFTIRGGAADAAIAGKQVYAEQLANQLRLPLVRLVEGTGGGGSVKMLEQMGYTYVPANPGWDYVVDNLSTVPVVAAGLGPVAGLGAARLCAAHLSVLVDGVAQLFVAGPPVVRSGTGEQVTKEELGGSAVHSRNAAVDLVAASEQEAFALIRRFLSYLPPSVYQRPPVSACEDPADRQEEMLLSAVPRDRRQPYRIRDILSAVFDVGSVMEVQRYGGSVVTALARLDGHPVGVVAGDPYASGGCLTVEGAEALTRLADLCTTFHLPVVTFTDQPGLLIGTRAEQRATIRHGVRAISAVYQAAGPGAEIIVRRVFGVGGAGMTNRHRLIRRWAWPSADWGSLPVEGGIEAAYRAELESAEDPAATLAGIRARLDAVRSPLRTAERFGIEEIIDPRETRPLLCEWVHDAYAALPGVLGKPSFGTRP
jgi:acetyl-CoA carboxylase carboxyltransferase component